MEGMIRKGGPSFSIWQNESNDLWTRGQTWNRTWHEGDWEHVSIQLLRSSDGNYTPQKVNLYNHYGGRTRQVSQPWWSSNSNPTYQNIQQGYDANHTHLHIWVAANAHALYNRYDNVYQVASLSTYIDNVDYDPANNDLYFQYDYLDNLGDINTCEICEVHGTTWNYHNGANYFGKEWLSYVGRVGKYWTYAFEPNATYSPYMPTKRRRWYSFEDNYSSFGNELTIFEEIGVDILWVPDPNDGD